MAYGSVNVPGNLPNKQDKLTGAPGQVVAFDASGTAEAVRGWSNQNLLDNYRWDSKENIINQRGQDEYTSMGYTIDRWNIRNATTMTVADDGITIIFDGTDHSGFNQTIECPEEFLGKTVTASILIDENTVDSSFPRFGLHLATGIYWHSSPAITTSINRRTGLISVTGKVESLGDYTYLNFGATCGNGIVGEIKIRAMKLELGTQQTLAHQDADGNWVLNDPPPNKALELAECQRHFIVAKGRWAAVYVPGSGRVYASIPVPTTMRANPAVITKSTGTYALGGGGRVINSWANDKSFANTVNVTASIDAVTGHTQTEQTVVSDAELWLTADL